QSVPLSYTPPVNGPVIEGDDPSGPSAETPKGKIYIFWGCGEATRPGQPLVIDLSKSTDPNTRMVEMAKFTSAAPVGLRTARKPTPEQSAGFGEWPNAKNTKPIKGNASLVGAHSIKGNYSPDISFALSDSQDFMPPVNMTSNTATPSGAVALSWQPLATATGYFATSMGAGEDDTVVLWSSSEVQTVLFGMIGGMDYIAPNDAQRLVGQKVLLSPATTTCQVPAQAVQLAPDSLFSITAFGQETNLSYPPRPEDPKV